MYTYYEWEFRYYRLPYRGVLAQMELWLPQRGWVPYQGDAARVLVEAAKLDAEPVLPVQ